MKLAEALTLRADSQKRLEQLKQRLLANAMVQEGDTPAEDPAALLAEYDATATLLVDLIRRINLTNASTRVRDRTMTHALAERDVLKIRHQLYRDMAAAATVNRSTVTRSEIRFRATVSAADLQQRADTISKQLRELDARIQEANWTIELDAE
jgi:hypothetical protein